MRRNTRVRLIGAGSMLAAFLAIVPAGAQAGVVVVSSNVPTLRVGSELGDNDRLEVAAGGSVRVLLPSGGVRALVGPFSGTVREITRGVPVNESLWQRVKELVTGTASSIGGTGATRSGGSAMPSAAGTFQWNWVPVTASGPVCAERGQRLTLWRSQAAGARELAIVDISTGTRATISFAPGATTAPWPSAIPPKADAAYRLELQNAPARDIRLVFVERAEAEEARTLATLAARDCSQQARAVLDDMRRQPAVR